ncbi:MAG TPA: GNAT family N-acetyltransferase [Thermoanaerobaculia bacterium]|nr:GNAT family N-acetyltransferase [Thermoanaerobaculia bacterium]
MPQLHTHEEDVAYVTRVAATNEMWVAEAEGRILGFIILGADTLLQIHVAADAQGRGVGSALFAHAAERRPAGFTLWTQQANAPARRFYESRGCRVVQLTDGTDTEEKLPDVQYEWRPPP